MSANRDDGGPAFPEPKWTRCGEQEIGESKPGMTLRDWFAGQALVGMVPVVCKPGCQYEPQEGDPRSVEVFTAAVVYSLADAMLAERAKVERGQAPDSPAAGVGKGLPAMPAPASVPHCKDCGLILDSDRHYCLGCGCPATCATTTASHVCHRAKDHAGEHYDNLSDHRWSDDG